MTLIEPFQTKLNFQDGTLSPIGTIIQRRLSDMAGMYFDQEVVAEIIASEGDRLIYEVFNAPELPLEAGQVLHCTTVIYPGRIGAEFHMTKGHFHALRDRAEIYVGMQGQGYVLLMLADGTTREIKLETGVVAYIPPYWAHRTVNVGNTPFSFMSVWAGDAGHDYGSIEATGFAKLLVQQGNDVCFIDNPKFDNQ